MILKTELTYVFNRILRFIYASLFTVTFFQSESFSIFFVGEGVIPLAAMLLSFRNNYNTRLWLYLVSISIVIGAYFGNSLLLVGSIILCEALIVNFSFRHSRAFNLKVDILTTLSLLVSLMVYNFKKVDGMEIYLLIISIVSLVKYSTLIYMPHSDPSDINQRTTGAALYRVALGLMIRSSLVGQHSSEIFIIIFRAINQIVLYVWSFIKSNSAYNLRLSNSFRFVTSNIFVLSWVGVWLCAWYVIENIGALLFIYCIVTLTLLYREWRIRFE